ncbi:membrane protein [Clostridium acetobutylicum]|nr:membrane protein [Clostridium acetobutylicum]
MNGIINLILKTFIETLYLTGIIILAGFILGFLRNTAIANFQRSFGMKAVMITGFLGVPVHELSHAIIAVLFGHKVTNIKLLQNPDEKGVLGYVNHTYNPSSVYQRIGNFFIGVAPIFGGITVIMLLLRVTTPAVFNNFMVTLKQNLNITTLDNGSIHNILISNWSVIKNIFNGENFKNPYFYLFLFIAICISSHISLSKADINGAWVGLVSIFLLILVINMVGLSSYISASIIIKYNVLMTGFLSVAVVFSCITFLISLVFRVLKA